VLETTEVALLFHAGDEVPDFVSEGFSLVIGQWTGSTVGHPEIVVGERYVVNHTYISSNQYLSACLARGTPGESPTSTGFFGGAEMDESNSTAEVRRVESRRRGGAATPYFVHSEVT
jgi:hypothetical protein